MLISDMRRYKLQRRDAYHTDSTGPATSQPVHHDVIHHSYRLFEQYCIDASMRVEDARLQWVRQNQSHLRADLYENLQAAVANNETAIAGTRVVLPASVTHSPRDLRHRFQPAMTICRNLRRGPDLFITMTCNPQWPEIQRHLRPWQTARDAPDLTSRVFKLKMDEYINDVQTNGIFGKAAAQA